MRAGFNVAGVMHKRMACMGLRAQFTFGEIAVGACARACMGLRAEFTFGEITVGAFVPGHAWAIIRCNDIKIPNYLSYIQVSVSLGDLFTTIFVSSRINIWLGRLFKYTLCG